MAEEIPAHRHSFAARSGDTHVIGTNGKAVNIDQKARDEAAPKKRAATAKKPAPRKRRSAKKPAPVPNPPVHHGAKLRDGSQA